MVGTCLELSERVLLVEKHRSATHRVSLRHRQQHANRLLSFPLYAWPRFEAATSQTHARENAVLPYTIQQIVQHTALLYLTPSSVRQVTQDDLQVLSLSPIIS